MQEGRPITYYSKSLDAVQQNYSTTEKELLSIVMCLEEYRKILYSGRITVYTDYKNLTLCTLSVQRVLQWRTFIDKFNVKLKYIAGKKNMLGNCFSRLSRMNMPVSVGNKLVDKWKTARNVHQFQNIEITGAQECFRQQSVCQH